MRIVKSVHGDIKQIGLALDSVRVLRVLRLQFE